MKDHHYYVYILTNDFHSLTYTGVTNDLKRRVWEHKEKVADGYTKKHHIDRLVYYEECGYVISAIEREKQIKAGSREKKNKLIGSMNPEWKDLYDEI